MFIGNHPYRIDEKGRLKLPADFARDLGPSFAVTRGLNGCLWLIPDAEWRAFVERLRGTSLFDDTNLPLRRFFIGSAEVTSLDNQARLTLPPLLREYAGITHEIVVMGADRVVEVWARDRWAEYQARLPDDTIQELARRAGL